MSRFTPGPWTVREYHDGTWSVFALGDPDNEESLDTLCKLEDGFESSYEANARLIAAAPELLEACQDALETLVWMLSANPEFAENAERLGMPDPLEDKLERAIAKATE